MDAKDFSQLLRARHSVRSFSSKPIAEEIWQEILDDARHCPSWSNTRPYLLAVATGEKLENLRTQYLKCFEKNLPPTGGEKIIPDADYPTWNPYPPELKTRSVSIGKALYAHLGIDREDATKREAHSRRNFEFFNAPLVAWVFIHSGLTPFAAQDAGILEQTLILSAQAHGIDSCPLGMLATWRSPIDEEFIIPEEYKLITGIAFGYASEEHINSFRAQHSPIILAKSR